MVLISSTYKYFFLHGCRRRFLNEVVSLHFCYFDFSLPCPQQLKALRPDLNFADMGRVLGAEWRAFSDEQKQSYANVMEPPPSCSCSSSSRCSSSTLIPRSSSSPSSSRSSSSVINTRYLTSYSPSSRSLRYQRSIKDHPILNSHWCVSGGVGPFQKSSQDCKDRKKRRQQAITSKLVRETQKRCSLPEEKLVIRRKRRVLRPSSSSSSPSSSSSSSESSEVDSDGGSSIQHKDDRLNGRKPKSQLKPLGSFAIPPPASSLRESFTCKVQTYLPLPWAYPLRF